MKAVISTTYDSKYLFFLPITAWCWNKLNVDVICFVPYSDYMGKEADNQIPAQIMRDSLVKYNLKCDLHYFNAANHKKATYAQCSRLYAACLDLPEDEVLITADVDMAVFTLPEMREDGFSVVGTDLVPVGQLPICYISAAVKDWRGYFNLKDKTYQQCLDELLGHIEAEHFRGNYWGKDQEEAFLRISGEGDYYKKFNKRKFYHTIPRSNGQNQFAQKRLDRDDAYILERDTEGAIDFHLPRPGYEHIETILTIFQKIYPQENFDWIREYTEQYKKLL